MAQPWVYDPEKDAACCSRRQSLESQPKRAGRRGKKEERFEREGTSALCALFFIKPVDALSPAQNCQRTAFFPFLPPIPNPLFACGQRVEIKNQVTLLPRPNKIASLYQIATAAYFSASVERRDEEGRTSSINFSTIKKN